MTKEEKEFIKEVNECNATGEIYDTNFGSNRYFYSNEDGECSFNSFGLEEFNFKSVEDFAAWRFDESKEVEYVYRYALGSINGDGEVEYLEDHLQYDPFDPTEDSSDVWSAPVIMKGESIIGSALDNPTPQMQVMLLPLSMEAKREILKECANDAHGLHPMGMIGRIESTYQANEPQMGKEKAVKMVAETYNFSEDTCLNIVDNIKAELEPIFDVGVEEEIVGKRSL
jgi:hypothetical protein